MTSQRELSDVSGGLQCLAWGRLRETTTRISVQPDGPVTHQWLLCPRRIVQQGTFRPTEVLGPLSRRAYQLVVKRKALHVVARLREAKCPAGPHPAVPCCVPAEFRYDPPGPLALALALARCGCSAGGVVLLQACYSRKVVTPPP
jgi:hypothetical protein